MRATACGGGWWRVAGGGRPGGEARGRVAVPGVKLCSLARIEAVTLRRDVSGRGERHCAERRAEGARVHAWAGSRDVRGQGKKEKKEERRREKEKEEREKRKKEKKKRLRRDSWSTRNRAHAKRGEQEN